MIYPTSLLPERYRLLAALNPLTGIIDAFRASLVPVKPIDWGLLGVSLAVTAAISLAAITYFRMTERTLADIV